MIIFSMNGCFPFFTERAWVGNNLEQENEIGTYLSIQLMQHHQFIKTIVAYLAGVVSSQGLDSEWEQLGVFSLVLDLPVSVSPKAPPWPEE